jgi:hypothetical protein
MKEAIHYIRKAIIARLSNAITAGGVTVPVYNRVPYNTSEPFIKVYSVTSSEDSRNQSSYITECTTNIEVITAFDGDAGGELQVNEIVNNVLELIRTRSDGYYDLSGDGFKVITCVLNSTTYTEEDSEDRTYFRAILEVSNKVLQT